MTGGSLKVLVTAANGRPRDVLLRLLIDGHFEVCRVLSRPGEVATATKKLRPDVIILSDKLEPSGLVAAITDVMVECPTPILIISAGDASQKTEVVLEALRAGALSVVRLPAERDTHRRARVERELVATIRAMAQVKLVRRWRQPKSPAPSEKTHSNGPCQIVAIAASTGGPAVLKTILDQLPADFPAPLLIVQHIAHGFVASVAEWLNQTSPLTVGIARNGERLRAGAAYFAPDDQHLGVTNRSSIRLSDNLAINGFRPSATYLFDSVGKSFQENALAVILTGMGDDGLEGLRRLAASGGRIIAQSEKTCVVFGMPGVVVKQGLADAILPPERMAQALVEACGAQVHE